MRRRRAPPAGLAPNAYVQQLRVEEAKKRLERTGKPVDEISFEVGDEDRANFRRLFKRVTQCRHAGGRFFAFNQLRLAPPVNRAGGQPGSVVRLILFGRTQNPDWAPLKSEMDELPRAIDQNREPGARALA
jgi:hypothetical protein